jgi:hypothetical protein
MLGSQSARKSAVASSRRLNGLAVATYAIAAALAVYQQSGKITV